MLRRALGCAKIEASLPIVSDIFYGRAHTTMSSRQREGTKGGEQTRALAGRTLIVTED